MKTILCPTDFSDAATNALRYADQLARWMQARVILFHNIDEPAPANLQSYGGVVYAEPIRDPGYRQAQLDRLEACKHQLAGGSQPVSYESKLRYGPTQDNIPAEASESKADLVALGSKHLTGFRQIFRGSVISEVISKSPCPVLIVPPEATFKPLTRIVFASNLLGEDAADLGWIAEITALFGAQIFFLHVLTHYSSREREQAEAAFDQFRHKLPQTNTSFHIETHDNIGEGISQFTHQYHADLLIMGYHPHGFWEGLFVGDYTQKMASQATLPLLVIHY